MNDVSAELLAEMRAMRTELGQLRATVAGLLDDFGPVLSVFRPAGAGSRPNYLELAGAARAARRAVRNGKDSDGRG